MTYTSTQQPEALRLAHTLSGGKLVDDSTEWADTLHAADAELRRQHARIAELEDVADMAIKRIAELEAQLSAIGAGGVEPLRKQAEDGWIQDGHLLYRLTDGHRPRNRDEINVTMANSSRTEEARTRRASELLHAIRAAAQQAVPVPQWDGKINPADFNVETFRRSGNGWLVKPDNCVRITHVPTGLFEEGVSERSIHTNKAEAWERLSARLEAIAAAHHAVPQWVRPVSELLGHISDVLPNSAFNKIDTAKWNAVSALVGAATQAADAPPNQPSRENRHE